ncbi:MAG: PAS domain-containing protein [bacterium]|nr:PAS domain-containing protein [bacterium]
MVHRLIANRPRRILLLDPLWPAAHKLLDHVADYHRLEPANLDHPELWEPLPDVVVLAVDHPDFDAWSWLEQFSQQTQSFDIPLVLTDGSYSAEHALKSCHVGAEDYWVRNEDPEFTNCHFKLFFQRHGRKLTDLQGFLGGLFRNLPNTGVLWFDENLDVLLAGGELLYKLGLSGTEMLGKPMNRVEMEGLQEGFIKYCRLALDGQGSAMESRAEDLELFLHFLPQSLSTGALSGLVVLQDVTPQRAEGEHRILEGIGDSLDLLIAYVDHRGKYLYANRAYCDWIQRPMSDILHKEVAVVLEPGYYERLKPHINAALNGEREQFELKYHFSGIGERDMLLSYTPHVTHGRVQGFLVIAQDVTALRESHRKLKFFYELLGQSNDIFAVLTFEDGRFIDFNQEACKRFGYSSDELLKLSILDVDAKLHDLAQWQGIARMTRDKGDRLIDSVGITKTGDRFPVEVSSRYVAHDGKEFFVVNIRDTTERLKRETAELERQMELSSIFKAFGDLYLWMNREGEIKGYQVSSFADLRLPPHRLIGSKIEDLLPTEVAERIYQSIAALGEGHEIHEIEYSQEFELGMRYYESRLLPVLGNQILLIARNVTERKTAQQALGHYKEELSSAQGLPRLGIWEFHLPEAQLHFSPELCQFLGYQGEEAMDLLGFLSHVPEKEQEEVKDYLQSISEKTEGFKFRHHLKDRQGREHEILHYSLPIQLEEGEPTKWLGLIQDLDTLPGPQTK